MQLQALDSEDVRLTNNGHTVKVAPANPGNMLVDGFTYHLKQCHFHYGSEHTLGGAQYELCVHCVHEKVGATDQYTHAVVGRFFTLGDTNTFLSQIQSSLPSSSASDALPYRRQHATLA